MYDPPTHLYTSEDLLEGFDEADEIGITRAWDFRVFQQYIADGERAPSSVAVRLAQATHDAAVAGCLADWIDQLDGAPLVGVMGGHSLARTAPAYLAIARLAARLTTEGFVIVSGGGPGAMEAAHVGAYFSGDVAALDAALLVLGKVPDLPRLEDVLNDDGTINDRQRGSLIDAHRWLAAALRARDLLTIRPGRSLAIPTWLYGQEPTVPFATAYAKYLQNSIREEDLVTQCETGIIYAQGGGGTIREIFQDVEQNYYSRDADAFTPMIFFDPGGYWERDATFDEAGNVVDRALNVKSFVNRTLRLGLAGKPHAEASLAKVAFTTEADKIVALLRAQVPAKAARRALLLEGRAQAVRRLDRIR